MVDWALSAMVPTLTALGPLEPPAGSAGKDDDQGAWPVDYID